MLILADAFGCGVRPMRLGGGLIGFMGNEPPSVQKEGLVLSSKFFNELDCKVSVGIGQVLWIVRIVVSELVGRYAIALYRLDEREFALAPCVRERAAARSVFDRKSKPCWRGPG